VKLGSILELSDRKARVFLVLIVLKRLFLEHSYMVFDKMPVRI
jgi:hypothetical protein